MTQLVESLKRLYLNRKITLEILKELLQKGTISDTDYQYIIEN